MSPTTVQSQSFIPWSACTHNFSNSEPSRLYSQRELTSPEHYGVSESMLRMEISVHIWAQSSAFTKITCIEWQSFWRILTLSTRWIGLQVLAAPVSSKKLNISNVDDDTLNKPAQVFDVGFISGSHAATTIFQTVKKQVSEDAHRQTHRSPEWKQLFTADSKQPQRTFVQFRCAIQSQ